ncbi:MAG: hypothetical protein ACUVUS_01805 [Thermoproteota archaeon]
MNRIKKPEIFFIIVLAIGGTMLVLVKAQEEEVKVHWLVEGNPSFLFDAAFSTCEKEQHV